MTASLITEEILVRLLQIGQTSIQVQLSWFFRSRIVITSKGAAADPGDDIQEEEEEKRLEAEIIQNVLTQYSTWIKHKYARGTNRYIINAVYEKRSDLHKEIFEFYEQQREAPMHTLSPLVHIARKHPFITAYGICNKTVKHTAVLFIPVFASRLVDSIVACRSFFDPKVGMNILWAFTALMINLVCATVDGKVYVPFVRDIEAALKMAIVQKLQILSMKFYSMTSEGKILSKLISDVQFVKQLMNEQLTTSLHLCIDIVFVCITAIRQLPVMLLLYAAVIPTMFCVVSRNLPGIKSSKAAMRKQTEKSNSAFQEMLAMERLNRAHGLQRSQFRRIFFRVRHVQEAANEQDWLQIRLNTISFGIIQGSQLLCLCIAVYMAFQGRISIGTVVLFKSLFEALMNSMQKFLDEMPMITQEMDSLDSISEILLAPDTEKDGAQTLSAPLRGDVTFEGVSFGYSPDELVLKNVSFHIPAGKTASFIGRSGSGKSTILNLLLGLYAPLSGKVKIDGIDVNELQKRNYRRYMAVVPQNPILFSGTLWENLVYGLNYVSVSSVEDAIERTGLKDLVKRHPEGLNQWIQEGGKNLSGGERQRIAIARSLLRNPRIILFDEATSALDAQNEREVQDAIETIMGTCTVIIVAHRLNTIEKADMVFLVDRENVIRQR